MRDPLVIAVAQPTCVSHDVETNALTHAAMIRSADARVVAFPELSLTGYELAAATVSVGDPRLSPVVGACAETGSTALVGAPVQGGDGRPYIAMLAVDGSGCAVAHRKMWLGAQEAERFAPGDEPTVYEVDGRRLGLAVCKEIGVAQHAADTASSGMDVYVAGTAEHPAAAELQDERALRVATGHGVHVAVASFAGPTGGGYDPAAGRSGIWTPDGAVLDQAGPEPGALVRAVLS